MELLCRKETLHTPIDYSFCNNRFQNILQQHTPSIGLGYEIVNRPKVEWDISSGCGYQMHQYDSVQAGEDDIAHNIIVILGTDLSADITDDVEYLLDYTLQIDVLGEGILLQNTKTYLAVDITSKMEFDIALEWNYINKPQKREDGSVPRKNDVTLTVGVVFYILIPG